MSINRKFARTKRKRFLKQFKKSMKNFEEIIRCVSCERVPDAIGGEKIDNWHIAKSEDSIQLTCPSCMEVPHVN